MSVKPVTVTTKHDTPLFDPEDHCNLAAQQMGLDPEDIRCVSAGPDSAAEVSKEIVSEDGTVLIPRKLAYTRITTWAERTRAPAVEQPPEPEPETIPWPTLSLPRGARWHGSVTIDGVTAELNFISDGTKLVLLDSAEGKAIYGGEPPVTAVSTGNSFG